MAKRIYVGNLPYNIDNQQLASMFGEYGDVVEASVITDRDTGQSKGFGFVQMAQDDQADAAIAQLNGTQLGNRTLRVSEAQPRPERSGGGGGYSRGGGYGGGGGGYGGGGGGYGGGSRRRDDHSWGGDSGYEAGPRGGRSGNDSW